MKDSLVYLVASGRAFFWGIILIALAVGSAFLPKRRGLAAARTLAAGLGLILIAVSGTPLPGAFYVLAGAASLLWIAVEGAGKAPNVRMMRWARAGIGGVWLIGLILEIPFHAIPHLPNLGYPPVYVVGDSLGAGLGDGSATWPRLLADRHGIAVHDLSRVGATVASAQRDQAGRVTDPDALVLAEIGGNDILGNTSPESFERDLDALLARLRSGRRTVVTLELPLPPFYNRFGEIQRRLAKRHNVWLVPKSVLMRVLTTRGATVDSLHLSADGHALLAEALWETIRPAFAK